MRMSRFPSCGDILRSDRTGRRAEGLTVLVEQVAICIVDGRRDGHARPWRLFAFGLEDQLLPGIRLAIGISDTAEVLDDIDPDLQTRTLGRSQEVLRTDTEIDHLA